MIKKDIWRCDWSGMCGRQSYAEVYVIRIGDEESSWSYLCRYHYYIDRLRDIFRKRKKKRGYYVLDKEDIEKRGEYDD